MRINYRKNIFRLCTLCILAIFPYTVYCQNIVLHTVLEPKTFDETMKPYQMMYETYLQAEEKFEENYLSAMEELNKDKPNYQIAVFHLNKCINLNIQYDYKFYNDHGNLLFYNGICNLNLKQQETAIESFNSASYWYYNTNNYDKAIKYCNITLQQQYNDEATFIRALCYANTNNKEKSNADYETIITRGSSNKFLLSMSYNYLAFNALKRYEYDKSMKLINKALEISKNISTIWDTRGELNYHLQKYEECISDMNKALSIKEGVSAYGNSYYYRGLAKLKLGKKASAKKDLKKAAKYKKRN